MADVVLVIGGTGRTGRQVVRGLVRQGVTARAFGRRAAGVVEGAEAVRGDITDPASVHAATQGVDGVVIAVESAFSDADRNSPARVHLEGVRHVAEAVGADAHVVLVTQIYITRADSHPEMAAMIDWRGRAEEALRGSGLRYTIVRPAWLTNRAGGAQAIRLEQGDTGDGEVAREDVAEVCVQALAHPQAAAGKTFEVYNEPGAPPRDWEAAFATLAPDR
jgi:uncharacterized protein YbjT (DUF2867 family)